MVDSVLSEWCDDFQKLEEINVFGKKLKFNKNQNEATAKMLENRFKREIKTFMSHKTEKFKYEQFKLVVSVVIFLVSVANTLFMNQRVDRLFVFLLILYHVVLTVWKHSLMDKDKASKIEKWSRASHLISSVAYTVLLLWPKSQAWDQLRTIFMVFAAHSSLTQCYQFLCQMKVLDFFKSKVSEENVRVDWTLTDLHRLVWTFLFPFTFAVYLFQMYLVYALYGLSALEGATWHLRVLSILFFMLAVGNATAMMMIIADKVELERRFLYRAKREK